MIRRPPRSTPSPTRPSPDLFGACGAALTPTHALIPSAATIRLARDECRTCGLDRFRPRPAPRSEEHTSELQSRLHLVCRLLLEKKKHRPPICRLKCHRTSDV